jgi:hypothetical protein
VIALKVIEIARDNREYVNEGGGKVAFVAGLLLRSYHVQPSQGLRPRSSQSPEPAGLPKGKITAATDLRRFHAFFLLICLDDWLISGLRSTTADAG